MTIRRATLAAVSWIAANMRPQDRREIGAVRDLSSTGALATAAVMGSAVSMTAWLGDEPVTAFGVSEISDGVCAGWAFGTDRMVRTVPAVTRYCLSHVKPALIEAGYRRLEVRTAIDHDVSHKWLRRLGFRPEGVCWGYGRDGLAFVMYAATAEGI